MKKINNYSPNMLKTFEYCPYKFFNKYIKKFELPQNNTFFETGKNIHALACYYLNKENIEKFEQKLTEKEKPLWKKLKNNKYLNMQKIQTEYTLSTRIQDFWIGGRLDALVKDNQDNYYILDYKTGNIPKNYQTDYQTIVYLLCVKKMLKDKNVNSLSFIYLGLKNEAEGKIELIEKLEKQFIEKIKNICEKMENSINLDTYSQAKNCDSCEYKSWCNY